MKPGTTITLYGWYTNGDEIIAVADRRRKSANGGAPIIKSRRLPIRFKSARQANAWSARANRRTGDKINRQYEQPEGGVA